LNKISGFALKAKPLIAKTQMAPEIINLNIILLMYLGNLTVVGEKPSVFQQTIQKENPTNTTTILKFV
jgi:hypothetical protein